MKSRALKVAASFLLVFVAAALRPAPARAQDEDSRRASALPGSPAPAGAAAAPEPRQVDSYGSLGHCDWTARLDNLAVELQNDAGAKGYVVSYSAPERPRAAAHWLKKSRHYLISTRGIDPSRVVVFDGGTRGDVQGVLNELWFVPEGAAPPVAPPAVDKYAEDFSGLFDTYGADLNVYQEMSEMGTPSDDISREEFAAKLKQQPDSVGYLVIRTPKDSAPGAWRRLARRDEQLLKAYGAEPSRLKSLDGGQSEGKIALVELWVLPLGAPPPAPEPKNVDWTLGAPARLHTFDESSVSDENGVRWVLENLAEFLRENPRASALLVAREPTPHDQIEWEDPPDAGEAAALTEPPEAAAEPEEADTPEESAEPEEASMKELAEEWKSLLAGKYGVGAYRVVVAEGRPVRWGSGRVNIWVVPEKGKWPDPSARDEDEEEQERAHGVLVKGGGPPAAAAPPR